MSRAFPFLIAVMAMAGCTAPAPSPGPLPAPAPVVQADPWMKYAALLGEWLDSTSDPRLRMHEQWRTVNDSTLLGNGYVLAGKDTVRVEDLMLAQANGTITYSARIDSRNDGVWVPFTALPAGRDSLVFENPGHDFPQCILYVRDNTGGWNVRVNGTEQGLEREELFLLQPQRRNDPAS